MFGYTILWLFFWHFWHNILTFVFIKKFDRRYYGFFFFKPFLTYDFFQHTILWLFYDILDILYFDCFITFFDMLYYDWMRFFSIIYYNFMTHSTYFIHFLDILYYDFCQLFWTYYGFFILFFHILWLFSTFYDTILTYFPFFFGHTTMTLLSFSTCYTMTF